MSVTDPVFKKISEQVAPALRFLRNPDAAMIELMLRWSERQRIWHGPQHLLSLVTEISEEKPGKEQDILFLTALYHDAIYDPKASDNEEASAEMLRVHAIDSSSVEVSWALEIIIASKWQVLPDEPLARQFFHLDTAQLANDCPLSERLAYERAIFREYQWAPWLEYREKRGAFLRGWAERFPEHSRGVAECLELLNSLAPRIAIYPGSFNPFHRGHLSILRQAEATFDKVIVAVGINRQKAHASGHDLSLHMAERQNRVANQLRFHEVVTFDGLLTDFIGSLGYPTTILRGVRDGTDLEAELRFSRFLNDLRPDSHIVWIACEAELQHLSSSAIRELEMIQPGTSTRYVPTQKEIYGVSE